MEAENSILGSPELMLYKKTAGRVKHSDSKYADSVGSQGIWRMLGMMSGGGDCRWVGHIPQVKGTLLYETVLTSDTSYKFRGPEPFLLLRGYEFGAPWPASGSIIC